jgi:release factor glutamine methyltransferase
MDYQRHHTVDHYLKKVRMHTEPYTEEILGKEIIIFPEVMSPKYDRSSRMMISLMPTQEGKDVLEVGSGTGIISVFCCFQGASSVTCLDINEHAVKNTEANFQKYGLENTTVLLSDLFEKVGDKKFDTVIFNAPYHGNKAQDVLELGTSDHNYETLQRFFKEVGEYLKVGARVILGFADTGDNGLLKRIVAENGFEIEQFLTQVNGDWTKYIYILKAKSE